MRWEWQALLQVGPDQTDHVPSVQLGGVASEDDADCEAVRAVPDHWRQSLWVPRAQRAGHSS